MLKNKIIARLGVSTYDLFSYIIHNNQMKMKTFFKFGLCHRNFVNVF